LKALTFDPEMSQPIPDSPNKEKCCVRNRPLYQCTIGGNTNL